MRNPGTPSPMPLPHTPSPMSPPQRLSPSHLQEDDRSSPIDSQGVQGTSRLPLEAEGHCPTESRGGLS